MSALAFPGLWTAAPVTGEGHQAGSETPASATRVRPSSAVAPARVPRAPLAAARPALPHSISFYLPPDRGGAGTCPAQAHGPGTLAPAL